MNIRRFTLLRILLGSCLVPGVLPELRAPITGDIEADIRFLFVAADTNLGFGSS